MKNILISEKQLADLVGKVKNNVSESHEPGSYMACKPLSNKGLFIVSLYNFVKFLERTLPTNKFGL